MKGKIYKITNIVNQKVYIGQTTGTLERRLQNHIASSHNITNSKTPLYNAMRKYGENKFAIELIGEYDKEILDAKEIEYIKLYDSYNKGYNATLGGGGWMRYDLNDEEVISKYKELKHMQKTADYFGATYGVIRKILTSNNIETQRGLSSCNFPIKPVKVLELDMIFETITACANYFMDSNLCKTKTLSCAQVGIGKSIRNNRKYCGYTIILL